MVDLQKHTTTVWTSMLYLMLIWGSSFILTKRTLESFTPVETASLRLSAAFFGMVWFVKPHLALVPKDKLPHLALASVSAITFPAYCFAFAQTQLPSAVAGVLNALTPAMVFICGVLFFGQPVNGLKIVGLTFGFIGSALLILVKTGGQIAFNSYALFIIAATVSYGFYPNWIKKHLSEIPALPLATLTVSMAGFIGICILCTTHWFEHLQTQPLGKRSFLAVTVLGFLGTAVAQFFFARMLQVSSALFAGMITYLIPIVAVSWGISDGEQLIWMHYVGILFILCGVIIISRFK